MLPPHIAHRPYLLLSLLLLLVTSACSNDEPRIAGGLLPRQDCPFYLNLLITDNNGNNLVDGIEARYVSSHLMPDIFLSKILLLNGVDSIPFVSHDDIYIAERLGKKDTYNNAPVFLTTDSLGRKMLSVYRTMERYNTQTLDDLSKPFPHWPSYEIQLKSQKIFGDSKPHTIKSNWEFDIHGINMCSSVTFDGEKCSFDLSHRFTKFPFNDPSNFYDVTILIDR